MNLREELWYGTSVFSLFPTLHLSVTGEGRRIQFAELDPKNLFCCKDSLHCTVHVILRAGIQQYAFARKGPRYGLLKQLHTAS